MQVRDRAHELLRRIDAGPWILLDGPVGTELARRGVDTSLPLWSAHALIRAPEVVEAIHRDYTEAGAEIAVANTFRTHRRSLARGGVGERAGELTRLAVRLARAANPRWVAGSVAPLEDCYSPELTPPDDELRAEHAQMCRRLADAGVDLILVETMPTMREACAAATAAVATGLPVLVGLACDGAGRLLSGEAPGDAARQLARIGVAATGIACTPAPSVESALRAMAAAVCSPVFAYGNVGHVQTANGWVRTEPLSPARYGAHARVWLRLGARLVGGCCGTTPEHVRELARLVLDDAGRVDR